MGPSNEAAYTTLDFWKYIKTCLKRPLIIDETNVLKTYGSLMNVESIAECSP